MNINSLWKKTLHRIKELPVVMMSFILIIVAILIDFFRWLTIYYNGYGEKKLPYTFGIRYIQHMSVAISIIEFLVLFVISYMLLSVVYRRRFRRNNDGSRSEIPSLPIERSRIRWIMSSAAPFLTILAAFFALVCVGSYVIRIMFYSSVSVSKDIIPLYLSSISSVSFDLSIGLFCISILLLAIGTPRGLRKTNLNLKPIIIGIILISLFMLARFWIDYSFYLNDLARYNDERYNLDWDMIKILFFLSQILLSLLLYVNGRTIFEMRHTHKRKKQMKSRGYNILRFGVITWIFGWFIIALIFGPLIPHVYENHLFWCASFWLPRDIGYLITLVGLMFLIVEHSIVMGIKPENLFMPPGKLIEEMRKKNYFMQKKPKSL